MLNPNFKIKNKMIFFTKNFKNTKSEKNYFTNLRNFLK